MFKTKILLRNVNARSIRLAEQQQLCELENRGRQPAAAAVFMVYGSGQHQWLE